MRSRTIGRIALVAVAGLLISATPPASAKTRSDTTAQTSKKSAKPIALVKTKKARSYKANRARKAKYVALRNARKAAVAAKQAKAKAAAAREKAAARESAAREKDIPAAVANANALMTAPDTRGGASMSGPVPLDAAAVDQLNELNQALAAAPPAEDQTDRIAMQLAQSEQPQTMAPEVTQPASPPPVVIKPVRSVMQITAAPSGDPWEQSSAIGKLFIAFGGLLTLASAARMLIA